MKFNSSKLKLINIVQFILCWSFFDWKNLANMLNKFLYRKK